MRSDPFSPSTLSTAAAVALLLAPCVIAIKRPIPTLASDVGIGADNLLEHLENNNNNKNGRFLFSGASLIGNIALTTVEGTPEQETGETVGTAGSTKAVGSSVFGPFEAGFGTRQDANIQALFGCFNDVTLCYSEGGLDVLVAQAICATNCDIELPRIENGIYYGMLDSCGGHTMTYHFHREMTCLYDMSSGDTHAPAIARASAGSGGGGGGDMPPPNGGGGGGGDMPPPNGGGGGDRPPPNGGGGGGGGDRPPPNGGGTGGRALSIHSRLLQQGDQQFLYGLWEDYSASTLPELDACNGHWGVTPDSPDTMVYHYHITETAPFSVGCFGPSETGALVTVAECRELYIDCSDTDPLEILTLKIDGVLRNIPYQPWCPCFDKSGVGIDGSGLNVGNAAASRAWIKREYNTNTAQWETTESGTLDEIAEFSNGITIVEISMDPDGGGGEFPSFRPSSAPSQEPSGLPTVSPSVAPVVSPSQGPSAIPSTPPTGGPTSGPTIAPTGGPTSRPTSVPTAMPAVVRTESPSSHPSAFPNEGPIDLSNPPSGAPSVSHSVLPTMGGGSSPTDEPGVIPSPTEAPSPNPLPSGRPSVAPIQTPTDIPSVSPTKSLGALPSVNPDVPTSPEPSDQTSISPSSSPSVLRSAQPSVRPDVMTTTPEPSGRPTTLPTKVTTSDRGDGNIDEGNTETSGSARYPSIPALSLGCAALLLLFLE